MLKATTVIVNLDSVQSPHRRECLFHENVGPSKFQMRNYNDPFLEFF